MSATELPLYEMAAALGFEEPRVGKPAAVKEEKSKSVDTVKPRLNPAATEFQPLRAEESLEKQLACAREAIYRSGWEAGRDFGHIEGLESGMSKGKAMGFVAGHKRGIEEGRLLGLEEGTKGGKLLGKSEVKREAVDVVSRGTQTSMDMHKAELQRLPPDDPSKMILEGSKK
ncbi:hypothetical protein K504DRAFT_517235 [Pleomassaria siparia CBS 279.74]|uniref:Essential protein Yae1 N-terminal domain-containing protein n=1 Tax=Pleomassaria siparia CBS 279.74 TaxID=1314801 RepID=A0A6G1KK94_9PLEO|nr:hypothetical protein K504DRAFT_517235 [Pleomassaria siparia CBS 279.74]